MSCFYKHAFEKIARRDDLPFIELSHEELAELTSISIASNPDAYANHLMIYHKPIIVAISKLQHMYENSAFDVEMNKDESALWEMLI